MRLVGYTIDEVMGKNLVQEFITKEYRAAVSAVLDKALRGKETANFEFPLITKNGVRIEVLLNATTRRDEQGNVIGVVGIGQDITARLAQEREYSKLIDTANAPIFGVDNEGRVNVWNQCARKLVGYSTDEVMGHSLVQEFITQDYQASVQAVLDQALAGVETANFEFPLITKAGARIEVLLNATTRRNEHGRVIGVVGEFCFVLSLLPVIYTILLTIVCVYSFYSRTGIGQVRTSDLDSMCSVMRMLIRCVFFRIPEDTIFKSTKL